MKKTQEQRVLEYMRTYGSITSLDAVRDLGIIHLPRRIANLKAAGFRIESKFEKSRKRYGDSVSFKRYMIHE